MKNFERIEKYLFGTMTAAEQANFENELAADATLAAEFQVQKAEHRAMDLLLQQDLRAQMSAWKSEAAAQTETARVVPMMQVTHRRNTNWMRLAAAASVLLVLGFWWLIRPTPQGVFDENSGALRGNSSDAPAVLQPSLDLMRQEKFADALANLEKINDSDWDETVRLLRGECQFQLKNYSAAQAILEPIVRNPVGSENLQKAEFVLLLTYWATDNAAAGSALKAKILGDSSHEFRAAAEEVEF